MQHTGAQDFFELGLAVAQPGTNTESSARRVFKLRTALVSELRLVGAKTGHVSSTRPDVPIKAQLRKNAAAALRVYSKRQTALASIGLIGVVGHRNAVSQAQVRSHLSRSGST
jgi:hypothetical protein